MFFKPLRSIFLSWRWNTAQGLYFGKIEYEPANELWGGLQRAGAFFDKIEQEPANDLWGGLQYNYA